VQSKLHILHLEDNQSDSELLQCSLERDGFACLLERVASRDEYLEALTRGAFDLIISDFSLPSFDGRSALQLARVFCPEVPFIFVSGTIGEETAIESLKNGASDYVLKDRLQRLVLAVRRALQEADERAERRRTERALRESEQRFRLFMDHMPALACITDKTGHFVYFNKTVKELFGPAHADLADKTDYDLMPPEVAARMLVRDAQVLDTGKSLECEEVIPTPDGVHRHWLISRFPLAAGSGQRLLACVARDITDREKFEGARRQSQKMEAVARLAGGIAHDFNNLLTSIIGYSQCAQGKLDPVDSLYKDLGEVVSAGTRAASLTKQLLTFCRKQIVQPRVLSLNEVVGRTNRILRRIIGAEIELTLILEPDLRYVKADEEQMEQVIMDLADNARDAMIQGGTLRMETRNVTLDEGYTRLSPGVRTGPYAMLAISDTGCGMDLETQSHLFEPFFTTKETGKGTGLGLAIVYGIVQQSGGHISVRSEVGRGTTFTIYLPQTDEAIASTDY